MEQTAQKPKKYIMWMSKSDIKVPEPPQIAVEPWRITWRHGVQPQINNKVLEMLVRHLKCQLSGCVRGATCLPNHGLDSWLIKSTCPVGYVGWKQNKLLRVGELKRWLDTFITSTNLLLGDKATIYDFFEYWDDEGGSYVKQITLAAEVCFGLSNPQSKEVSNGTLA
jgi:hypothetical protein